MTIMTRRRSALLFQVKCLAQCSGVFIVNLIVQYRKTWGGGEQPSLCVDKSKLSSLGTLNSVTHSVSLCPSLPLKPTDSTDLANWSKKRVIYLLGVY